MVLVETAEADGRIERDRDESREQGAEEGVEEGRSGGQHERDAIARREIHRLERARDAARALVEVGVAEPRAVAVVPVEEAHAPRRARGAFEQRSDRSGIRVRHASSLLDPLLHECHEFPHGREAVLLFRLEADPELVLDLDHQLELFHRVELEIAEQVGVGRDRSRIAERVANDPLDAFEDLGAVISPPLSCNVAAARIAARRRVARRSRSARRARAPRNGSAPPATARWRC